MKKYMFNFKGTLMKKLLILLLLISIIPVVISSGILLQNSKSNLDYMVDEKLEQAISAANYNFHLKEKDALLIAQKYAQNEEIISAFKSGDRDQFNKILKPIFSTINEEQSITIFEFGDDNGVVFARAHNPEKYGDDKSSNHSIEMALQGKEVSGFEVGSSGLGVRSFVPIKSNGKVIGTVQVGFNLDNLFLQDLEQILLGTVSLYNQDKLIITSNKEEEAQVGQTVEDKTIFERVKNNENVKVIDGNIASIYYPLYDPTNETIQGMFRVEQDLTSIHHAQDEALLYTIIIIISTFILALLISVFFSLRLTRPIKKLQIFVETIANGDLTKDEELPNSRDEIYQLFVSYIKMKNQIKQLIEEASSTSEQVSASSEQLVAIADESSKAIGQIASSSQTAAEGAEQQLLMVNKAKEETDRLLNESNQIVQGSKDMASVTEQTVHVSKEGGKQIDDVLQQMKEIDQTIKGTSEIIIELGKQSEEIGSILTIISDIAEQTNLLSLNAAIEAARAGEQGKGFAVVADEVRKLAIQSQDSTKQIEGIINNIQIETKKAITSIHKGTEKVSKGLDKTIQVNEAFNKVESSISNVNQNVKMVSTSIDTIVESVNKVVNVFDVIRTAAEEGAAGSQENSAATQEQLATMQELSASSEHLAELAQNLQLKLSKFKR